MPVFGYARTSTEDQLLDLQMDALTKAGADQIFTDQASGAKRDRPGLASVLAALQPGDTLIVWRLDRLGRSLSHLSETVHDLNARGIAFRSLAESIDTSTATGRLILHMFGSIAEFERDLAQERILAGIAAARARGRHLGRRRALTLDQAKHARELQTEGKSLREIARILGGRDAKLSASTVKVSIDRLPDAVVS